MKCSTQHGLPALLLCAAAAFVPIQSAAEDIDIFTGAGGGTAANPKILIILDNTSNWSEASQQWPGGLVQGQAEARAINTVLGSIGSDVNLGLMEFVTDGNATETGGFIRRAIKPMNDNNKVAFSTQLTNIYNDISGPHEKRGANTEYGNLMYNAYLYFNGGVPVAASSGAVNADRADSDGYTANYTRFKSPLSDANVCGRNFVIFIGNPAQAGPKADGSDNGTALTGLGGSVSPQLQVPEFQNLSTTTVEDVGYSSQCYATQAACSATDNAYNAAKCAAGAGYDSCSCSSTRTTALETCQAGTLRYSVTGHTITSSGSSTADPVITHPTNTGITGCHASAGESAAAGDFGGLGTPVPSVTTQTSGSDIITTTTTYSLDSYQIAVAPSTTATQDCSASVAPAVLGSDQVTSTSATTTACYGGITTGNPKWNTSNDYAGLDTSCPATSVVTSGNDTITTTYQCTITGALSTSCGQGKNQVLVTHRITGSPSTVTSTPRYKFDVTQTLTASAVAVTAFGATDTPTVLGNTAQCYSSTTNIAEFACSSYNGGCTYGATTDNGLCPSGNSRYLVTGSFTSIVSTPTGIFKTPATAANADEWARFMHQPKAMNPVSTTDNPSTIPQSITTYTIDVFNRMQDNEETELYMSMARVGGGKYFAAKSEAAIVAALKKILVEIQSVNTTFASASLPVNATNRTQNANQVFIGMFRPDPDANPRWFGNLKQYAIGKVGADLDLVDKFSKPATNALTGFIDDCATSFWTTDSTDYWRNIVVNPDAASKCDPVTITGSPLLSTGIYSDLPDGPTVEKGAVAEVLRKGNPSGVTTGNRTVLTGSGSTPANFTTTSSGLAADVVDFTLGKDIANATGLYPTNANQPRPSIHGDVVHSRPLPVNYGSPTGVTVYYGANDGTLRSIDASNGRERWAYVAPEHYAKLKRLMDNTPGVDYKTDTTPFPTFQPKDYFFDGSIGIYQAADGSPPPVWIYPTQRRGGRRVYGFDVSEPASNPTLKWRKGCSPSTDPALAGDIANDVCDTSFGAMGQTWSTPNVAFINGYSPDKTTKPVVVMGGGYDKCEDTDAKDTDSSFSCSATKGNVIYFIDADTGALITSFATLRSVAADVNMIDINNDGLVDYAYAADTGGNIYRIDFVSSPTAPTALPCTPTCAIDNSTDTGHWNMHKVAYTNGGGRKFLFGPALFPTGSSTYVALVSGDREHPLITNYPYTAPVTNRAYIYKDNLTSTPSTAAVNLDGAGEPGEGKMLDVTTATNCDSPKNLLTDTTAKGWFMDLTANGRGEQGVTSAVIVGGMVTFSTNRPFSSNLSCNTRLGEARGYFVNLFNGSGTIGTANNAACTTATNGGSRSATFAGGGLPPSPVIGIVPIGADSVPTAVLIGAIQRDDSSSSPIKPSKIVPPINPTRTRTYKYIKGDN